MLAEDYFHIHHIENVFQRALRSSMHGRPMRDKSFVRFIPFSNLSSWNNHTFNELKQCNYEIGTAILPARHYNMKSPITSGMFSLAHFHSLDIFHLLSVNPLATLKGQLEHRVSEHRKDSLHFLFTIPLPLSDIFLSFHKTRHVAIKV